MKRIVRELLSKVISDIDSGNSDMSEDDEAQVIKALRKYTRKDNRMSKYQACKYLNISRSTFDALVRGGLLPRGIKQEGFKELSWLKKDLEKYKSLK